MTIYRTNIPIYEILIYFSIIIGAIYIYISVDKSGIPKKKLVFFFFLFFFNSIFLAKLYSFFEQSGGNIITIGLTGYGGLIGAIAASLLYFFIYKDKRFIKYTIISLPLIYGFAKLACFFNGCCYGIPYNGPFSVKYPSIMNKSLFPIQLVETICFIILFNICNFINKHKNIIYITLILTFILKFLLDFFRYSHIYKFLSNNQIVSIILCFITIIIYFINRIKASTIN